MRTTFSVLLLSLFFVSENLLVSSITVLKPVRDIKGNDLQTGKKYRILPLARGMGGEVTLGNNRNGTFCILDVIQKNIEVSDGTPVTFTPVDPNRKIIRVSSDLNVEFSAATVCMRSLVWKLGELDEATGQTFITTRGEKGNPGTSTLRNWFQIRTGEGDFPNNAYKLVFCPRVCNICRPICKDIGVYIDIVNGTLTRRLALLSDDVARPFMVMFKKVESSKINLSGSDVE